MSLEILTEDQFNETIDDLANKPNLARGAKVVSSKGAKLVSGFIYTPETQFGPTSLKEVKIVYEIPDTELVRLMKKQLMSLGYRFWGGLDAGILYLLKLNDLAQLNEFLDTGGDHDLRYALFGSRKLYKAFLQVLDERRLKGLITDEEYLDVRKRVESKFNIFYGELGNEFNKNRIVRESRAKFEDDPLIHYYVEMARSRLS